ncbi:MAG TPA: SpoIID/LytB domain-containing protein, partial [Bacteroidales bacterium]|nr:SpoIID/LytB domain-containing protein [Bacteroidales bacterium]
MGSTSQKTIEVGILLADSVSFQLEGNFGRYSGSYEVSLKENRLFFEGMLYDTLCFAPDSQACSFVLKDVVIGIDFHWERKEDERFKGALRFIPEKGKVRAINSLSVEDYLISVIASEMSATSTPEYLKAHAVISRSWLLSQIEKKHDLQKQEAVRFNSDLRTPDEWIKWWDREDHDLFDVCADDHCQRYQGITRPSLAFESVKKAVEGTCGEVLTSDGTICDARFSKCCGGFMETFPTSWEPVEYSYLQGNYDGESFPEDIPVPDLT